MGNCITGYWKNETGIADVCQQCTSVDNALDTTENPAVYTCTSADDTQLVGNCTENHWKNSEGNADVCLPLLFVMRINMNQLLLAGT